MNETGGSWTSRGGAGLPDPPGRIDSEFAPLRGNPRFERLAGVAA